MTQSTDLKVDKKIKKNKLTLQEHFFSCILILFLFIPSCFYLYFVLRTMPEEEPKKLRLSDISLTNSELQHQYFFEENFISVSHVDSISKVWQSDPKNCNQTRKWDDSDILSREFYVGQNAQIAKDLLGKPDSIHSFQNGETYIYITDCPPDSLAFNVAVFVEFRKNRIYAFNNAIF